VRSTIIGIYRRAKEYLNKWLILVVKSIISLNIMKSTSVLFLCLIMGFSSVYGQQQFLREDGGLSVLYGLGKVENSDVVGAFGALMSFRGGYSLGIAQFTIENTTYPRFIMGMVGKSKETDAYIRGSILGSYVNTSMASVIGFNGEIFYLINAQQDYPTSFDCGISLNYLDSKNSNPSELLPIASIGINQSVFLNQTLTPYFGVSIGYDLKNSMANWSVGFGINLNFGGMMALKK
jgi:hypothetical protein